MCIRTRKGKKGFTLIEIMLVVAVIGLLVMVVAPSYTRARQSGQAKTCMANLKHIVNAKELWAMGQNKDLIDTPSWSDLVPRYLKSTPACPTAGEYALKEVAEVPTCTKPGHEL